MKLTENNLQRLGIYFFFDKDGIVDRFVTYFLDDLVKSLDRLVIVCNGKLSLEGQKMFSEYTSDIIVRENKGLDVWAYKTALEYIGWDVCEKYDEIILCNSTSMGPVYPFAEMFHEMNGRDVDFWGITKFHGEDSYMFESNPYGYTPEHIQSYFIAYRKSLIKSSELRLFWNEMPEINSYSQSIGIYESVFTKKFADLGFRWDVYVNTDDLDGITDNPIMFYPKKLISERRCPVFKRRTFFHMYNDMLIHTVGQSAILLYDYIKNCTSYDENMIWDAILRCYNLTDIYRQMHLNYTLSSENSDANRVGEALKRTKVALIMHVYFSDLLGELLDVVEKMPEGVDIFITTDTEEKKAKIQKACAEVSNQVTVHVVQNRGRDVSALLVGMRDVVRQYDLVCFSHDKKATQNKPGSVGEGFAYQCYANILYNKAYVENVISLFIDNPRLGMAVPPVPSHGEYYNVYGRNWGNNFEQTQQLCRELGVHVPMSKDKNPVAPYGSVFWFRPCAMKKLFDRSWAYEDFPEEPLPTDGTISHAIERCYGFVAQDEGYYSAVIMSDFFARIEYTNLEYLSMLRSSDPRIAMMEERLRQMYESTSWKISKPIRVFGELTKTVTRKK